MTEAAAFARPSLGVGVVATSLGGALGALMRWALTEAFPAPTGHFPWAVLVINVVGSGLLATPPLLSIVSRKAWAPLFLGTGVLGGFTTMSAASTDTFTLLDRGEVGLAAAYCLGTLAAVQSVQGGRRRGTAYAVITVTGCLAAATLGHLVAASLT